MTDYVNTLRSDVPMRQGDTCLLRLMLLLLAFLPAIGGYSQKLTLRALELSDTDLTARRYERIDLNGERCALIKVQLPIAGCEFAGNKVGDVEFKVNEYWLYVTAGTKRIYIQCPGLESSMIIWEKRIGDQYGVTSGSTYMMYLDGYSSALTSTAQAPVKDGNYLVMNLTPSEASVRIDGKQQALPKDGKLSLYLSSGTHSYEVSAYGYATSSGVISMGTDRQSLDVTLTSLMASLTLSCATQGAEFYVNDERVGEGDWSGSLAAGKYHVEARKDGYRSQYRDVTLGENARETISFPDLTALLGCLDVNYDPVDTEVWLDGTRLGVSPNVWDVTVGSHTVEVRSSGYASEKRSVSIVEGQTLRLSGSLKRASAVSSNPTELVTKVHEYVDLGLSVKWATCNVGASSPEEYGSYSSYDAARVNRGTSWRLPTKAEFEELINSCTREWVTQGGVKGIKFTSKKNGKSIFLPAAGWFGTSSNYVGEFGYYWSSTPNGSSTKEASSLYFNSGNCIMFWRSRQSGFSVRPVTE